MQIDVMLLKVLGKNNMKSQNEKKRDVWFWCQSNSIIEQMHIV